MARCKSYAFDAAQARRRAWRELMLDSGHTTCEYCGCSLVKTIDEHPDRFATVDHKVALALAGLDEPDNWALCCAKCNNEKGTLSVEGFLRLRKHRR